MIEDHIILTTLPFIIRQLMDEKKPGYSLPDNFKELWQRRKELINSKDGTD